MKRMLQVLLASATVLAAGGDARANPRVPPEPLLNVPQPVTEPAEIGTWLQRLAGRYRVEGVVEVVYYENHRCGPLSPEDPTEPPPEPYCTPIKGSVDCVAVGAGAGLQCVLDVAWRNMYHVVMPTDAAVGGIYNLPGGVPWLSPSMALFGVDPRQAGINYLLVDHKGLPEGGLGFIKGDTASFKTPCVNAVSMFNQMGLAESTMECLRTLRVNAKPGGKTVNLSMDIEIEAGGQKDLWTRIEMTLRREPQTQAAEQPEAQKR